MARTVEESVINAIMSAFVGTGEAREVNPTKSYMAIATSIPKEGEHYKCKRLEKNHFNGLSFRSTKTSTVQKVQKLAGNVYVVKTRNSYYVTRVLYMPAEDVHFAVIYSEPVIGSHLKCYKLECSGEKTRFTSWKTTSVQEVKFIKGLYRVKTRNSTYICYEM